MKPGRDSLAGPWKKPGLEQNIHHSVRVTVVYAAGVVCTCGLGDVSSRNGVRWADMWILSRPNRRHSRGCGGIGRSFAC